MSGFSRRELVAGVGAVSLAGAAIAAPSNGDPHKASGKTLTRIAWGSCAKSDKPQPIWDAVLAAKPDLFIFLGDNIYADTRDPKVMAKKYAQLAAQPGFKKLRKSVPICAIWDDHDYGENDAGADYPMKDESKRQFLDFWGESAASPRRARDGIYASYMFGPAGQRVQLILPDLRWNRTPLASIEMGGKNYEDWAKERHAAGKSIPGPYARQPEDEATMIGEPQWKWLEQQLAAPADFRIFGSSLQVLADFAGWEGWINYARDHQRLFQAIREKKANNLICISGDTHYGEVSKHETNTPYPIWDFTSSGLTEVWPVTPPNARRVGEVYRAQNFGLLSIEWNARRSVTAEVRGVDGKPQLSQQVFLDSLQVKA